jgi:hypothetical protein
VKTQCSNTICNEAGKNNELSSLVSPVTDQSVEYYKLQQDYLLLQKDLAEKKKIIEEMAVREKSMTGCDKYELIQENFSLKEAISERDQLLLRNAEAITKFQSRLNRNQTTPYRTHNNTNQKQNRSNRDQTNQYRTHNTTSSNTTSIAKTTQYNHNQRSNAAADYNNTQSHNNLQDRVDWSQSRSSVKFSNTTAGTEPETHHDFMSSINATSMTQWTNNNEFHDYTNSFGDSSEASSRNLLSKSSLKVTNFVPNFDSSDRFHHKYNFDDESSSYKNRNGGYDNDDGYYVRDSNKNDDYFFNNGNYDDDYQNHCDNNDDDTNQHNSNSSSSSSNVNAKQPSRQILIASTLNAISGSHHNHQQTKKLFLPISIKDFIHINCDNIRDLEKALASLSETPISVVVDHDVDVQHNWDLIASTALITVEPEPLYIILGKMKIKNNGSDNKESYHYIILVPQTDSNELLKSIQLLHVPYKTSALYKRLYKLTATQSRTTLNRCVYLYTELLSVMADDSGHRRDSEAYNLRLDELWRERWGQKSQSINIRRTKKQTAPINIHVPITYRDRFAVGSYVSNGRLNSKSCSLHSNDPVKSHAQLEFSKDLPNKTETPYGSNLRQESLASQSGLCFTYENYYIS